MARCLRTRIIRIGNSQGIRIPKTVLEQIGLEDEIELVVEDDALVIRPVRIHRQGWEEQFAALAAAGGEADPGELGLEPWEEQQWTW